MRQKLAVIGALLALTAIAMHKTETSIPLLGQVSGTVRDYTAEESANGITLRAHEHNLFLCQEGGTVLLPQAGPLSQTNFWVYEYDGRSAKTGSFFLSPGALEYFREQGRDYASFSTLTEIHPQRHYYVMTNTDLHFQCGEGFMPPPPSAQKEEGPDVSIECDPRTSDGILDCTKEKETGNVYVTMDPTPIRSQFLLGGSVTDTLLQVNLLAKGEDIKVTGLSVHASGESEAIDRLELYTASNEEPFALATISGCLQGNQQETGHTFCATFTSSPLLIPNLQEVDLHIRARMKSDEHGVVSGKEITLQLIGGPDGTPPITAVGQSSKNALSANNGDGTEQGEVIIGNRDAKTDVPITSAPHLTALSHISSIENANPDPDGSAVPTGQHAIGLFAFHTAANSNNKDGKNSAVLDTLIFDVSALNVALQGSSFALNNTRTGTSAPCNVYNTERTSLTGEATGQLTVECTHLAVAQVQTELSPGTEEAFALLATITDPNTAMSRGESSTLQVVLQGITNVSAKTFGIADGDSHIVWIDRDETQSHHFLWVDLNETTIRSTAYSS